MASQPKPPTLSAKIDWYSFTVALSAPVYGDGPDSLRIVHDALQRLQLPGLDEFTPDGTWRLDTARGFYASRATHLTSGLSASWGPVNPHLFVELPGQACSFFQSQNALSGLIQASCDRASRVDAAIDILTQTTPQEFVEKGHAKRFGDSVGFMSSTTGQTCYVGSRKGDRCARVYRYFPPHPRAHLLRVEAEYKHDDAKALARVIADAGDLRGVATAHTCFEWASDEIRLDFLDRANLLHDHRTNPVTVNIIGLTEAYFQPWLGTKLQVWLMWDNGLAMLSRQRWQRRPRLVSNRA